MEIIVGNVGFCFGVKRAVAGITNDVKKYGKIKCLGEIVHNERVIDNLKNSGVSFVSSLDEVESGETLVLRAHGVGENVYKEAEKRNIKIIDYTCPKVELIHKKIKEMENNGYQIILIGKKDHPEVIGSAGFSKNVVVIEKKEEIEKLPVYKKVFVIVQTTFSKDKYLEMEKLLKEKYKDIVCLNTICDATKTRQDECRDIAKKVDAMIIVGGQDSSNTRKLYDIAKEENENVIFVNDCLDKEIENISKYDIIGIISGASTPEECVREIIDKIKSTREEKWILKKN